MAAIRNLVERLKQRQQALRVSTVVQEKETQTEQPADEEKPVLTKKKYRWFRRLLLTLVILPFILVGSVLILAQSEGGTRALFRAVHVLSAGSIDTQWRSGSLAHGGSAERVLVNLPKTKINITNLSGEWSWDYLPLNWRVSHLSMDEVFLTVVPKVEDKPAQSVLMPFAFEVNRLKINAFHLMNGISTTTMSEIDGAVKTDKRQHQINLTNLTQGSAYFSGQASVDGERPFRMTVDMNAQIICPRRFTTFKNQIRCQRR
jgi:autotransporter translocation and assembly factor TamB